MKSYLGHATEWLGVSAPTTQVPDPEQDAQALYGNAFVGGLFDQGEDDGGAAFRELVEEASANVAARVELQKKLTTEAGVDGKAQVSPEEFEETVELYSDIRRGKTNLQIDTTGMTAAQAAAFTNGTMDDMATLMQTKSGREMIESIARNDDGRKVVLGQAEDPNAPKTSPLWQGRRHADLDVQEQWELDGALRGGNELDSRVVYQPDHTVNTADGDIRSDVVLYHELVHAYHFNNGTTAQDKYGRECDGAYVEDAELQATQGDGSARFAENLYRMERRRLGEDMPRRQTYHGRDVDELMDRNNPCPAY